MTALYFLATIVLLVVIHEWGHFATARFFGVGVRSFTVGFGKQFVSWVDPKTGTSWGIAPYPVGGYVGLLGEKEATEADHGPAVTGKPFLEAPLYAKLLVLVAGPAVNLIFAALLYALLAYSSPNPALPILAAPPIGSPAHKAGVISGVVVRSINGETVSSWRELQTALLDLDSSKTLTLTLANSTKTLETVQAQPSQTVDEALGLRLLSQGLTIQFVVPDGAASQAGMRADDVMLSVNGINIDHPSVLIQMLQAHKFDSPPLAIEVVRGNEKAIAKVKPQADSAGLYKLGVQFAGLPALSEHSVSVFGAIQDGFSTAYLASVLTVKAFGQFLLKPFNSDQLAGPITIAKTAKASADRGWISALAFIAGLSISVGVLNLLPVPMLDGGQIVYHSVKGTATRLGLSFKIRHAEHINRWWTALGVSFVIVLTLLAFFTDFKRLFGF
jgi:regulator of sigma E protease